MYLKSNERCIIMVMLFLSATLLSILVPGGPIENRDFSTIDETKLLLFNVFLTFLAMSSYVSIYFVWKKYKKASYFAFFAGLSYFGVYIIDLAYIFPQSPTPMSFALFFVEVLGTAVSLPLMVYSAVSLIRWKGEQDVVSIPVHRMFLFVSLLIILSGAIIYFATHSAIHSGAA